MTLVNGLPPVCIKRRHPSSITIVKLVPVIEMVEVNGFEPMTSCVQGRRSPN